MTLDKMTIDKTTVHRVIVDEMSNDKMTCWQNDMMPILSLIVIISFSVPECRVDPDCHTTKYCEIGNLVPVS